MVMGKQIPDFLAFICIIARKIFQNLHQVQPDIPEPSMHLYKMVNAYKINSKMGKTNFISGQDKPKFCLLKRDN